MFMLSVAWLVAQLTWQTESLNHLETERANWEILKQEAIKTALEEERQKWQETGEVLRTYNIGMTLTYLQLV